MVRQLVLLAAIVSYCCLLSASTAADTAKGVIFTPDVAGVGAAPLVVAWSRDVPLGKDQVVGGVFVASAPSRPGLVAVARVGPTAYQRTLEGLALADGTPLWRSAGIEDQYDGDNYTLPFWRAGPLRLDALVADYYLEAGQEPNLIEWRGFALLDPKTGKPMVRQDAGPHDTNTAQLSRWGFLYMIHTRQSVNNLMRLQAPDYSPDSPAAVFTFPSSSYSSSINSNLLLAQRRGLLFNSYAVGDDGTTTTTTLQRLDPASLKPVWTRAGLQGALSVVEPAEEVVVVAQDSGDRTPWTTQLDTYAVTDGSPKSRWLVQWDTPEKVTLNYAGAVLNHSSGEQRLCARLATGWSLQLAHAEWLTCVDPLTSRVTLNVTLKAAGEPSARAGLLAMYDTWALLQDKTTGSLLAFDCFGSTNNGSEPTPSWTLAGQRDLASLTPSEDGLSFLVAQYRSGRIARWNRIAP